MLAWAEPVSADSLNRVPLAEVDPNAIKSRLGARSLYPPIKRTIDIVVVILALPGVIPALVIAAILILVSMGRPIFFVQPRVGLHGRVFRMVKLRTMRPCTDNVQIATALGDSRITPVGQFLRRSHLDELPQLWNILTGHMTLVGPRPEQPALVERYRREIPHYDLRHTVTPGLSGLSQVCFGYAGNLQETREKLEYDLYYLRNFGLAIDWLVLVRTFRVYLSPQYVR